jgi:hypothetical protein
MIIFFEFEHLLQNLQIWQFTLLGAHVMLSNTE